MFSGLNRRQKAGLFVVLVTAGLGLLFEASWKEVAGVAMVGVALAWAVGSDSRLVHWTFVGLGSTLLMATACYRWYDHRGAIQAYESRVAAFERDIPELAKQYSFEKTSSDPQTGARMGWNGAMWVVLSSGNSAHKIGDEWDGAKWIAEPNTPAWAREALIAGVNIDAVPYVEKPNLFPPEPFSLTDAALTAWRVTLPGAVLLCVGLGLVIGVRARA